ncbi:FtsB family cell division protein [Enterococcus bulliens]
MPTDFAKEQYANYAKQQRQVIYRRRRLFVIFAVAAIVAILFGISLFRDFSRLHQLETYQATKVVEKKDTDQQITSLKKDVALLEDDDYVAKLARSRYFYSKEDEINFRLPDEVTQSEEETTK